MTRKYIILLCIVFLILCVLVCLKFFWRNKPKPVIRMVETMLTQELIIHEPYTIDGSSFSLELLQIDSDENRCFLEMSDSNSHKKINFWASPNRPIPEINNFVKANTDVIMITILKEKSVVISIKGGYSK